MLCGAQCSAQGQTRADCLEDRPTILQQGWGHIRGALTQNCGLFTLTHTNTLE